MNNKNVLYLSIPLLLSFNCISTLYLQSNPMHINLSINEGSDIYTKHDSIYSVILRGNLIKDKYGFFKVSFKIDSLDTIKVNKKDIILLNQDIPKEFIVKMAELSDDSVNLSFNFNDENNIKHTIIIGKKHELNKMAILIVPITVIADIITSPIQIVGGIICFLYVLFGGKTV